jgi:hypothetical protein
MWTAAHRSVCALSVATALTVGVVSVPPAVTHRTEVTQVVHVSDVTLAAVSSSSPSSPARRVAASAVPTPGQFVYWAESWLVLGAFVVLAPVLLPTLELTKLLSAGFSPGYFDIVSNLIQEIITYPSKVINGAATALGDGGQTAPTAAASRQVRVAVPTSSDSAGRHVPMAGAGKGHSAVPTRGDASKHRATAQPQAKPAADVRAQATGADKFDAHPAAAQRSGRGHGARSAR